MSLANIWWIEDWLKDGSSYSDRDGRFHRQPASHGLQVETIVEGLGLLAWQSIESNDGIDVRGNEYYDWARMFRCL